jgi:hypothetical protein
MHIALQGFMHACMQSNENQWLVNLLFLLSSFGPLLFPDQVWHVKLPNN